MITCPPVIYDSLVRQFWATAEERNLEGRPHEIVATVDGQEYIITESSVWASLQLHDEGGLLKFNEKETLAGMVAIHYPTDGTFTFLKNKFTPQWRFLIHTLLQCISPKSGGWDQFASAFASGLICLSDGRSSTGLGIYLMGWLGILGKRRKSFSCILGFYS